MSQVVTGEAVALDLRTAALPSRLVAGIVDVLLQAVLLGVLALVFGFIGSGGSEALQAALSVVLLVTVVIGYPVLFETVLRGRTPGKAAMGLRVVRDDGGPIVFRQAFVRGLSSAFLEKPGLTFFVLPVVCMLLTERGKRFGDLIAGTVVLQERVPVGSSTAFVQMPPPLAPWAAGLELSGMSDDLALSVRQFVARSAQLHPASREQLGSQLVEAVRAVTAPPPPSGTPGWAFLAAVLAERRNRELARLAPLQAPYGGTAHPPYPRSGPQQPPQPAYGQPYGRSGYGQPAGDTRPPTGFVQPGSAPADRPGTPAYGLDAPTPERSSDPRTLAPPPESSTGFALPG